MDQMELRIKAIEATKGQVQADKDKLARDKSELVQRYQDSIAQYETLKTAKAKHWNEIVATQLSANLLIEVRTLRLRN